MTTLIILTSIAVITLLIGFFEIRIPFIYKDPIVKHKKAAFPQSSLEKYGKIGKLSMKTIKDLLRTAKTEVSYFGIPNRKTSEIAR